MKKKLKLPSETTLLKEYYTNPELNRIANARKWGRVFGESTMLDIMLSHRTEADFIAEIESNF